jgi:hypothetical protein
VRKVVDNRAVRPSDPLDPAFIDALLTSYATLLGEPLVPASVAPAQAAAWLYGAAEFAVLAHDTEEDPCFVYANLAAQRCFERSWEELVGMPSRLSAEAPNRAERASMLAQVKQHGFIRDYRGLRIAKSGRRFWIEQGIVWNIARADGTPWGQAAMFSRTTPYPA